MSNIFKKKTISRGKSYKQTITIEDEYDEQDREGDSDISHSYTCSVCQSINIPFSGDEIEAKLNERWEQFIDLERMERFLQSEQMFWLFVEEFNDAFIDWAPDNSDLYTMENAGGETIAQETSIQGESSSNNSSKSFSEEPISEVAKSSSSTEAIEQNSYDIMLDQSRSGSNSFMESGHPSPVVIAASERLKVLTLSTVKKIRKIEAIEELEECLRPRDLMLLQFVSILSRSAHNRSILLHHDGGESLLSLARSVIEKYVQLVKSTFSLERPRSISAPLHLLHSLDAGRERSNMSSPSISTREPDYRLYSQNSDVSSDDGHFPDTGEIPLSDGESELLRYLVTIIDSIMDILANVTSAGLDWQANVRTPLPDREENAFCRRMFLIPSSFLEFFMFNAFFDLLRAHRATVPVFKQISLGFIEFDTKILDFIGGLLAHDHLKLSNLRTSSLYFFLDIIQPYEPTGEENTKKQAHSYLKLQFMSLKVIRALVERDIAYFHKFYRLRYFERLLDFILYLVAVPEDPCRVEECLRSSVHKRENLQYTPEKEYRLLQRAYRDAFRHKTRTYDSIPTLSGFIDEFFDFLFHLLESEKWRQDVVDEQAIVFLPVIKRKDSFKFFSKRKSRTHILDRQKSLPYQPPVKTMGNSDFGGKEAMFEAMRLREREERERLFCKDALSRFFLELIIQCFDRGSGKTPRNSKIRDSLRFKSPILQFGLLRFVKRLDILERDYITLLAEYGIFDILFSQYFFFWNGDTENKVHMKDVLRSNVIFVLEACGIYMKDPLFEVTAILEQLFVLAASDYIAVYDLSYVLFNMYVGNREAMKKALFASNAAAEYVSVIDVLHRANKASDWVFNEDEMFVRSFNVCVAMLSISTIDVDIIAEWSALETNPWPKFFSLLQIKERTLLFLGLLNNILIGAKLDGSENVVVSTYIDMIPRSDDIGFIVQLMDNLCDMVQQREELGTVFVRLGAFVKLLTILHRDLSKGDSKKVMLALLKVLRFLLSSEENRDAFEHMIGYDQLKTSILFCMNEEVGEATINGLCEVLVRGEFDAERPQEIQNPIILLLILEILSFCSMEVQVSTTDKIFKTIEGSSLNQSMCVTISLTDAILERIQSLLELDSERLDMEIIKKLYAIVEIVGGYNISVKELKAMFELCKPYSKSNVDFRSPLIGEVLKTIRSLSGTEGPSVFFDFSGFKSGIILPKFDSWVDTGYSFATWINIRGFDDLKGQPMYHPRLFSFLSEEGNGFELYFVGNLLQLCCYPRKGKAYEKIFYSHRFKPGIWYFLCLTHSPQNLLLSSSEICLYVNGDLIEKDNLRYLLISEPLTNNFIGTNATNHKASIYRECSFNGLMGQISFFYDVLTQNRVKGVYHLGPNYLGNFDHSDLKAIADDGEDMGIDRLLDAKLSSKAFIVYNAKATSRHKCVNIAASQHLRGTMLGSHQRVTRDIRDIIHCIGGPQVLFPLFAQLDFPEYGTGTFPVNYRVDTALINNLLEVLMILLKDSPSNQSEFIESGGFGILMYLFKNVSPIHFSTSTCRSIKRIVKILIPEGKIAFLRVLFSHLNIWVYSPATAQKEVLRMFLELLSTYTQENKEVALRDLSTANAFAVSNILDTLRFVYYFEPTEEVLISQVPPNHAITGESQGEQLTRTELSVLQGIIFDMLKLVLLESEESFDKGYSEILEFLAISYESEVAMNFLKFFMTDILSNLNPAFSGIITKIESIFYALFLLEQHEEPTRILAINFLVYLLSVSGNVESYLNLRSNTMVSFLSRFLNIYPLTIEMYKALLALSMKRLEVPDLDDMSIIVYPSVIQSVLKLSFGAKGSVKKLILRDLIILLSASEENRTSLANHFGWQETFLNMLTDESSAERDAEDSSVIFELVINILILMLNHCVRYEGRNLGNSEYYGGEVEKMFSFLVLFALNGELDASSLSRNLVIGVLQVLKAQLDEMSNDRKSLLSSKLYLENLVKFMLMIEYIIFHQQPFHHMAEAKQPEKLAPMLIQPQFVGDESRENEAMSWSEVVFENGIEKEVYVQCKEYEESDWEDWFIVNQAISIILLLKTAKDVSPKSLESAEKLLPQGGLDRIFIRFSFACLTRDRIMCVDSPVAKQLLEYLEIFKFNASEGELQRKAFQMLSYAIRTLPMVEKGTPGHEVISSVILLLLKNHPKNVCKRIGISSTAGLKMYSDVSDFLVKNPLDDYKEFLELQEADSRRDDLIHAISLNEKMTKLISELIAGITEADKKEGELYSNLVSSRELFIRDIIVDDTNRLEYKKMDIVTNDESSRKEWIRVLVNLVNEKGAWGKEDFSFHWQLDKREDKLRRRPLLRRNFNFDIHELASKRQRMRGKSTAKIHTDNLSEIAQLDLKKPTSAVLTPNVRSEEEASAQAEQDEHIIREGDIKLEENNGGAKRTALSLSCILIWNTQELNGKLRITEDYVFFIATQKEARAENLFSFDSEVMGANRRFSVKDIIQIHRRRYLLRNTALEIFLSNNVTHFFVFDSDVRDRNIVLNRILSLNPKLRNDYFGPPTEILRKTRLTERWQKREISNFEYLMELNTIAGRTYNDLGQYPIFPWILSDYKSRKIDLEDTSIYRDLSKPVGALNEDRLEELKVRYEAWEDPDGVIPKFMYGSHYSTAGVVLYYLIRMEPFTTFHINFQSGRFDVADRLFHSIEGAWNSSMHNSGDVKELIPEFFYFPEFLQNTNSFDFGILQDSNAPVDNVMLPNWARSKEHFISVHRAALESDYVSNHLDEWIDLIFGYKQRGQAAVDAYNVFFYLTYEDAVDLESIDDPNKLAAIKQQILEFGQTPTQVFRKKHPKRNASPSVQSTPGGMSGWQDYKAYTVNIGKKPIIFAHISETLHPMISSFGIPQHSFTIDTERKFQLHKLIPKTAGEADNVSRPFRFETDTSSNLRIGVSFDERFSPTQKTYFLHREKFLFSCGYYDNSFRCNNLYLSKNDEIICIKRHSDVVNCIDADGNYFVTGSRDTTCMVWKFNDDDNVSKLERVVTLFGHTDEVTAVSIYSELEIVASGSVSGQILLHSMNGRFIRALDAAEGRIDSIIISKKGLIIVYSSETLSIYVFSLNGELIRTVDTLERISSIIFVKSGNFMLTGGEKGYIVIRRLMPTVDSKHLAQVARYKVGVPITCIRSIDKSILTGTEAGSMTIFTLRSTNW